MEFSTNEILERVKEFTQLKELEKLGFSSQVLHNWKVRNSIPKSDDLFKIAQFCGCSMEYLLTGQRTEDDDIFMTAEEQKLLHDFKTLDPASKKSIIQLCEALTGKIGN